MTNNSNNNMFAIGKTILQLRECVSAYSLLSTHCDQATTSCELLLCKHKKEPFMNPFTYLYLTQVLLTDQTQNCRRMTHSCISSLALNLHGSQEGQLGLWVCLICGWHFHYKVLGVTSHRVTLPEVELKQQNSSEFPSSSEKPESSCPQAENTIGFLSLTTSHL